MVKPHLQIYKYKKLCRLRQSFLYNFPNAQIGEWQSALKQAEINGEIGTVTEAENWLENELSFDNKET